MVEDKKEYLEQLEDIKRRSRIRKAHGEYRKGERFLKDKKIDPTEVANVAYELLQKGIETGDIQYSLLGAQLYEKIGRGRKVIPRLLKAAERSLEQRYQGGIENTYSKIETFIKRNTGKRGQDKSSLEKKFGIFIAFIIGGVALGLGSLTITGNAVSNLSQTTPGLLGILLFIAGLVGMFFYFKGK